MGKRFLHLLAIVGLVLVAASCQTRKNASGRVGMGYLSRANQNFNFATLGNPATGQISVGSQNDISNFFTNYINSDGTPFLLPCPVNAVTIWGQVQAAGGSFVSTSIPSSGAQLHLDFILSCSGRDPVSGSVYNDIRVDIADGTNGYVGTSGQVSNGSASISFSDEYGQINVVGQISSGTFNGSVTFANNYYYGTNGYAYNPGYTGTIGSFNMQTAAIFQYVGQ